MKTLTKNFGLSLIFGSLLMLGTAEIAQADCLTGDCKTKSIVADSTEADVTATDTDEFNFDFESPFFFDDKVVINVYNQEDELVYSKALSKEEADCNAELKAILKQSEYLLSIDNQHYYSTKYTKDELLARK